ncbi:hypothetical protein GWI33_005020 [Rhynchophorus ferrugineus]|uniref:Protein transport protein Sec24A n=1 Tax=Rhynchophorus ferrugineus TaxID=354439 RepID=A0A834INR9_RHYFE|nr:hypothetical protein GWI33_005020 [Rhynchophorus ferrugineus]
MSEPNGVTMPQTKQQYQFNGINSNDGSRGSSPVPRAGHIPASQLPPMRANIPAHQLPPTRNTVSGITQKVGQLTVSNQNTPNISPNKLILRTPTEDRLKKLVHSENTTPVVPNSHAVPPLSNVPSDVINKNVTLSQSNIINTSTKALSDSQSLGTNPFISGTTSQYFDQSGSQEIHVSKNENSLNFQSTQQSLSSNSLSNNSSQINNVSSTQIPNMGRPNFTGQNFSQSNFPQLPPQPIFNQNNQGKIPFQSVNHQPPSLPSGVWSQSNSAITGNSAINTNANANLQPVTVTKGLTSPDLNAAYSRYPPQVKFPQPSGPPHSQPGTMVYNAQAASVPMQNAGKPVKPRYPQTISSSLNQPQNVGILEQNRPQFNTGLSSTVASTYPQNGPVGNVPGAFGQPPVGLSQPAYGKPTNFSNEPVSANQPPFGVPTSINGPTNIPPPNQTNLKTGISGNRYPAPKQQQQQQYVPLQQQGQNQSYQYGQTAPVVQSGFNRLWGTQSHDLLQIPNILPPTKLQPPQVNLGQETLNQSNCNSDVFSCTMTKIPETASLLQKARLPLGLLIHPFKDLSYLPVIQCNIIVRCRACRTYINPFVNFVDSKRWKCNLCYRINELPEEFQYDPVSKTYGDPSRRPEIKSSTIEYIAPAEYMLRPPQPAVYLFLMDVSRLAVESCYLNVMCNILLEELKHLPGDARTQIGFLAYDSSLHFFSLAEGQNQPHEMTVLDIDDVFLPTPDNLLVNLKDRMEMVEDLLHLLPQRFANTFDGNSALGAALQVAHKLMAPTGGRVTIFQSALPNVGPGAVTSREDPNQRASADVVHLNPANDFYKKLALDCSAQQIAVDLFVVNSQYVDIATISGISRFSGGCINHFPLFKINKLALVDSFQKSLRRYLTRKIGFEAVMRVRCTRGLSIHTFHGNFFVRSTDLLSLPNINPDAAFGMQVAIDESLADCQTVCFQAALLYTSSKGERRIRVHTLCMPVANVLQDVINSAHQQCVVGLLGKMAADRSMQSSLSDAREAFINAVIDCLTAYKFSLNMGSSVSGLLVPDCLKLLPLYISAILKHPAFRIGMPTRLDDRVKAMIDMKTKPLPLLMQSIYPDMYPIHNLESQEVVLNSEEEPVPMPPRLQLSARFLENKGAFLMDCGDQMLILVGPNVSREFLTDALGVTDYGSISDDMFEIPILSNPHNQRLHQFMNYLNDEKPYCVSLQVIRDNSPNRIVFLERLIEDRLENSLSYHEFLQHLKTQVK